MPNSPIARACAVFLLIFTAVAALTWTTEQLVLPTALQAVAVPLYRLVYFVYMPLRHLFVSFEPLPTAYVSSVPPLAASLLLAAGLGLVFAYLEWKRRRTARMPSPSAIGRRALLERCAKGAVLLSGGGAAAYASVIEPGRIAVRRYVLPIADLPPALDGLRIVHISDTHYGPFMPLSFIARVVGQANALDPDIVLLTGDYVHRTPKAIPEGVGILAGLQARHGVLAVLGNHDHWEGAEAVRARFAEIGLPLIENTRRFLTPDGLRAEPAPGALCIGGVGDYWEDAVLPERALESIPVTMPRLLLSHNPDVAEYLPKGLRVDLMLSGHTHGGQVRVPMMGTPIVPSEFGSKYAGGLCEGPQCPVLVSRGVGMAIIPVRFAIPPEIGLLELRRASAEPR